MDTCGPILDLNLFLESRSKHEQRFAACHDLPLTSTALWGTARRQLNLLPQQKLSPKKNRPLVVDNAQRISKQRFCFIVWWYNSNCFALVNFLLKPFDYDQVPYMSFLVQWYAVDAKFQHGWIPWSTDMVNALRVDCQNDEKERRPETVVTNALLSL